MEFAGAALFAFFFSAKGATLAAPARLCWKLGARLTRILWQRPRLLKRRVRMIVPNVGSDRQGTSKRVAFS